MTFPSVAVFQQLNCNTLQGTPVLAWWFTFSSSMHQKNKTFSEKTCPNSQEANLCLGDHNSNKYWHCWSWLEYSIQLVPWFLFSLAFCHRIRVFYGFFCHGSFYSVSKTNSTLEFNGKNFDIIESNVLDLGWSDLGWLGSKYNGNVKPMHLSLSWKLLFMLSGRFCSTLAWKERDRISWGQVRSPPARLESLFNKAHVAPEKVWGWGWVTVLPGSWVTSSSNTSAHAWALHCSWPELCSHTEAPRASSLSLGQRELWARRKEKHRDNEGVGVYKAGAPYQMTLGEKLTIPRQRCGGNSDKSLYIACRENSLVWNRVYLNSSESCSPWCCGRLSSPKDRTASR